VSDADDLEVVMMLRRATGTRMMLGGVAVALPAVWWIRNGLAEDGDALLIWGPGGVALVIAVAIAIAGIVHYVKRPKLPPG
jgi:hypothetical protein